MSVRVLAAVALLCSCGGSSESRPEPVTEPPPPEPWAPSTDCASLCTHVVACAVGPFSSPTDCADACEGAEDSPETAETYSCLYEARDCTGMRACESAPAPEPETEALFPLEGNEAI